MFQSPPKLRDFSQYSSPLMPQFSAEATNLFHIKQQQQDVIPDPPQF